MSDTRDTRDTRVRNFLFAAATRLPSVRRPVVVIEGEPAARILSTFEELLVDGRMELQRRCIKSKGFRLGIISMMETHVKIILYACEAVDLLQLVSGESDSILLLFQKPVLTPLQNALVKVAEMKDLTETLEKNLQYQYLSLYPNRDAVLGKI